MPLSILVFIVFRVESSPGGEAVAWRTRHHNSPHFIERKY